MGLMYKQFTRQIFKNKIFAALLLVLIVLTSLSFFFVKFSIDGNLAILNAQASHTSNQVLYKNALNANTSLAYSFLVSLMGLTSFVLVMFFYRFFRSNRKQVGCLKSLGFRDNALRFFFVVFVAALSTVGALLGMIGGYFLSSVLINANIQTYNMAGLVKSVSAGSIAIGLVLSAVIFSIVAYLCYGFVRGKQPGELIGDVNKPSYGATLRAANAISSIVPIKDKTPLRIALRKPVAVLLVFVAVMAFSVCMILGRSLNISSQKVMNSQTIGHQYAYDVRYADMQSGGFASDGVLPYLELSGVLSFDNTELEHTLIALYGEDSIFGLQDGDGQKVQLPTMGGVVIGSGLCETYGLQVGDTITVSVNGNHKNFKVLAVAANAKTSSVYIADGELTKLAGLPAGHYNGEFMANAPNADLPAGTQVVTQAERIKALERNAVSNNISAVINQATGVLVGCILIFLALYVNFQDNTRDMLILHLMGYRNNSIRKMLVNVYQPIVWLAFLVTLLPSIELAKFIQRSLSITTNDYMPFGTNIWVVLIAFVAVNVIYMLVQAVFSLGIKRIISKGEIAEYTSTE